MQCKQPGLTALSSLVDSVKDVYVPKSSLNILYEINTLFHNGV